MEAKEIEFYKCKDDNYSNFEKGKVYNEIIIGELLYEYPEDWQKVLPYPTTKELKECIIDGRNKTKVIKALKQWEKTT